MSAHLQLLFYGRAVENVRLASIAIATASTNIHAAVTHFHFQNVAATLCGFGRNIAEQIKFVLLAGDALQSFAFETLAGAGMSDLADPVHVLARAAGSRGMAGGQAIDLLSVDQMLELSELERMHRLKTGALIRAAVRLGADCGQPVDADGNDALLRYASAIGLAFQVVDDVLDVEGTAQSLGKTAGKDAVQRKSTYVTLLGLAVARERTEALRLEARAAVSTFGIQARRLEELADWIVARTH